MLFVLLEDATLWVVLPSAAFVLMCAAIFSAIGCLGKAVIWLLQGRPDAWPAIILTLAATTTAIASGWFLYRYYLIPIASQFGR